MKNLIITLICFAFMGTAYADLNEGLIAYYPFDGNVKDISGNENHGEAYGTTLKEALVEDRDWNPSSAFSFDGIDDYIRVPDSETLDITTNKISISVWINMAEPLGHGYPQHYVFDFRDGENGYGFNVDTDVAQLWIGLDAPNFLVNMQSKEWHHVAVTYNKEFMSLYINGELNSHNYFTEKFTSTIGPLWIGQRYNFIERFWGIMDDLRIYDRILSEEEIIELYEGSENEEPEDPEIEDPEEDSPDVIRIERVSSTGCFIETVK